MSKTAFPRENDFFFAGVAFEMYEFSKTVCKSFEKSKTAKIGKDVGIKMKNLKMLKNYLDSALICKNRR